MTARDKAIELIDQKVGPALGLLRNRVTAKKIALVLVDEVIGVYRKLSEDYDIMFPLEIKYWEQVKEEIERF